MIPLRDENPTRTLPIVVYGLVAANIIVFLYSLPYARMESPLAGYALVPRAVVTGHSPGAPLPIAPWMTIFTSMFMHANLLHIAGNMLFLWIFGNNVEDTLGHFRFLLFYLAAGVVAAFSQIILAPFSTIPMVGASGAIAGVLGAYLVLFPGARVLTMVIFFFIQFVELPASIIIGLWIITQIVSLSVMEAGAGGVAYAAHVGGFVAGFIMISVLGGRRLLRGRRPELYRRYHRYDDW